MQLSRVIITYLIIWDKLALNGARIVKNRTWRGKFRVWVKLENEEMWFCPGVYDLSNVALLNTRGAT